MSAKRPEDIHELFADGINAGDVERVASLFEDDAILVSGPDHIVRGRDAIVDGLRNLVAVRPTLRLNAARIVRNGSVAILYSDWTITTTREGEIRSVDVRPTHLARQQPDGTWRIVIDDPSAGDDSSAAE
jgi:uncharacterized protein (TIGR02246 family)